MMETYLPHITLVRSELPAMIPLLTAWADINSCSDNLEGLHKMCSALEESFGKLGGQMRTIPLPPRQIINHEGKADTLPLGKALHIQKHPAAPLQVFFGGHMDTVYPRSSPFQKTRMADRNTMVGPGVADMKGGLIILLKALEVFEKSPWAGKLGWEILITPDEEIGSPGSLSLLKEAAKRSHIGLVFEPSFQDGCLVSARKGSAKFTAVAGGRPAHAGRDFHTGRSAIVALAKFIVKADALNAELPGITLNFGRIEGGGAVNIVPASAICRMDARADKAEELKKLRENLQLIVREESKTEGISILLHETASREPKPFDEKTQGLFASMKTCAELLAVDLRWRPTGGVCDGNTLAAAGLPTLDTLGAVGGNLHTMDEFIDLNSLSERACLTLLFLMRLADGKIILP